MIKKYQKKPAIVEALQWNGDNIDELKEFVGDFLLYDIIDTAWEVGKGKSHILVRIKTLEGEHIASIGDYIIKGIKGEFYPCKPDIFEKTYEEYSNNLILESFKPTNPNFNPNYDLFYKPIYFRNVE